MRVLVCLALTSAFAPLAPVAVRRDTTQSMKKPSPALEQGPLPGLSETNYKVLAGIAALGFGAPALLFVANVVVPGMEAKNPPKPPAKKPAAGQAAPAAAKADANFALPTLPKSKSKTAPSDKAKDQSAKKLEADRAKAEASAAATAKREAQAAAKAEKAAAQAAKAGKPAPAPAAKAPAPAPKPAPAPNRGGLRREIVGMMRADASRGAGQTRAEAWGPDASRAADASSAATRSTRAEA